MAMGEKKIVAIEKYTTPVRKLAAHATKGVRVPFGYYGAKGRIARQIVSTLPPHNAWVEAFCGSAALTLAKPPAPIEVINDLDDQVVNLFRQLRSNGKALRKAVALTPYARAEFEMAREERYGEEPLERARQFLVSTMMTVNATSRVDRQRDQSRQPRRFLLFAILQPPGKRSASKPLAQSARAAGAGRRASAKRSD